MGKNAIGGIINKPQQFIIIGENIHATRVLAKNGHRIKIVTDDTEIIPFTNILGQKTFMSVPEWYRNTQPYSQGHIKHFMIAMMKGISDDPEERKEGAAYIQAEALKQIREGAQYLDVNVDEVHYDIEIQKKAMRWTIETVQAVSSVPISVDSSSSEIIASGLSTYNGEAGRPILNSISPERPETLEMIQYHNARVIVMATSGSGMPENTKERVENAGEVINMVRGIDIQMSDIFVDPILFPISVDSQNGNHYFEAVREIRKIYGTQLHIGMGLSNVSFGMPNRKLINSTFIRLALGAGIDAGIIDPIQTNITSIFNLDTTSEPYRLAKEMLLGQDEFCMKYIQAYRDGSLD